MARNHEWETIKHRFWVMRYIGGFALRLLWRGVVHDLSKFKPSEAVGFQRILDVLETHEYGSDEYQQAISTGCIQLHQKRNSHHPEYYPDGIASMSLLDIVEMLCDWRAAVRRSKNGDIQKSIWTGRSRFGPCSLWDILRNETSIEQEAGRGRAEPAVTTGNR